MKTFFGVILLSAFAATCNGTPRSWSAQYWGWRPATTTQKPTTTIGPPLPPPAVQCPIWDQNLDCPNGRVVDNQGCTQNVCQPADGQCNTRINCFATFECLPADIGYSCPNGARVDDCGCQVSGCQCAGCPDVTPTGAVLQCTRDTDSNGCPLDFCA